MPSLKENRDEGSDARRETVVLTGIGALPPVKASLPSLKASQAPLQAMRIIALSCLRHLQSNQDGFLGGRSNPEHIHQMRVAIRRLRSAFKVFAPVLPEGFVERWDPAWAGLGGLLGHARNWDIVATKILPSYAASYPHDQETRALAQECECRRRASYAAVGAVLASNLHGRLLTDFAGELSSSLSMFQRSCHSKDKDAGKVGEFAVRRLDRQAKRTIAMAQRYGELDAAELHRVRIALKRLRYGLEFFSSLLPQADQRLYLDELVRIQDALGEINDLATAQKLIAGVSGFEGKNFIGAWLAGRQDLLQDRLPGKMDRFLRAKAPWHKGRQ